MPSPPSCATPPPAATCRECAASSHAALDATFVVDDVSLCLDVAFKGDDRGGGGGAAAAAALFEGEDVGDAVDLEVDGEGVDESTFASKQS